MDGAQRERGKMDRALQAFLQGRTPLTEERVVWSGGGRELVQTRGAYALEAETALPLGLVTSVRAVLTRGRDIMVVRDPGGEHIVPGGRIDDGEELLEALKRELMEETGWSVRGTPTRLGLFHYHIHSPKPERYPYPYPDFLQINLWNGIGFSSIIYLAGILGISPELFEAAKIDGAGKLQQIRYITLPMLYPMITILTLLAIGRIFHADFGLFFFLPRGNPLLYSTTDVIDTFVYRSLVELGEISMAAAAGFYQSFVGFLLVVAANWVVRRFNRRRSQCPPPTAPRHCPAYHIAPHAPARCCGCA